MSSRTERRERQPVWIRWRWTKHWTRWHRVGTQWAIFTGPVLLTSCGKPFPFGAIRDPMWEKANLPSPAFRCLKCIRTKE